MQDDWIMIFPPLNAALNTLTTALLVLGFAFIRKGNVEVHKRLMISAFCTSAVFLACYITYHVLKDGVMTRFEEPVWAKYIYFPLLGSHTILAIVALPMILLTMWRGIFRMDEKHRAIARWTWPIWIYVSFTGVLVYLMLYQWFPQKKQARPEAAARITAPAVSGLAKEG
ncbi:DUF420 domain-containing protein [Verrucomicrobia bacterium LW23]|nr:DUF420 domain-containing protein [Verrucomicrobia bacterium LW23]